MPGVTSQPSLLVKKADGTSVRMSWDEFKAYKSGLSRPDIPVVKTPDVKEDKTEIETEIETKIENLPMKEPVMPVPATTAPVKKIFEYEARVSESPKVNKVIKSIKSDNSVGVNVKQWTNDDSKSPLVEEVKGARKQEVIRTTLPADRGDAFDVVIRNLKFPVRDELRPRLKSLIVSRVKDIRDDEQVGEYAMRSVERGGLGLTEGQVGELLGLINIKTQNTNNITQITNSKSQVPNYQLPVTSYPDKVWDPVFHRDQLPNSGEKPVLHDVVAPALQPLMEKKVGVGPMEEFSTFEIKDFRRLGQPAQASEVLIKKFETMRAETLILYLRAVKAWQQSPLYKQYQQVIVNAINQGRSVKEVVSTVGLKFEEFEAITKVCSNL